MACFAGPIVALLYGDEFDGRRDAARRCSAPTIALYGLQSFSATLLIARDAPGVLGRVAGGVAVQNIACNAIAIPLWGADGAAGVALSSSVLMAGWRCRSRAGSAGGLGSSARSLAPLMRGRPCSSAVARAPPLPAIPAGALALHRLRGRVAGDRAAACTARTCRRT